MSDTITRGTVTIGEHTLPAPGRVTIGVGRTGGSHRWVYVITPLPDGSVYGVGLVNAHTGGSPAFDTFDNPGGGFTTNEPLSRFGEGAMHDLSRFLVDSGYPSPTPVAGDALEAAREEGRAEMRAKWEAWKEHATEVAHTYADDNSLCSEFDRCMAEIGLPGRSRTWGVTVEVTAQLTVYVEATTDEEAAEMVDSSAVREAVLHSDAIYWPNVEVDVLETELS